MFESIGRDTDEEAKRRRRLALLIQFSSIGLGATVAMVFAILTADEISKALEPDDGPMAQLIELEEPRLEEPPAAPKLIRGDPKAPEPVPTNPDEPPEDPAPLPPVQERPIPEQAQGYGSLEGDPRGSPNGDPRGTGTGDAPGCVGCSGTPGGGVLTLHHSEVEVKRKVEPHYPLGLRDLGPQRCVATLRIDTEGRPTEVTVEACEAGFHEGTVAALMRWRFKPVTLSDGTVVPAQFRIAVSYKP